MEPTIYGYLRVSTKEQLGARTEKANSRWEKVENFGRSFIHTSQRVFAAFSSYTGCDGRKSAF